MNIKSILERVQQELIGAELKCKELRRIIAMLQSAQRRFDSLTQQPPSQFGHGIGLTAAVRDIINSEPEQLFCTAQIQEILAARGFHLNRRKSGAVSTVLSRLGKEGFITITTDGEGNRTYKRIRPETEFSATFQSGNSIGNEKIKTERT